MKQRRLQTKRQAKKGFRALYARLDRKQKASTTADVDDIEGDIPKVGIGKALTVILILHVVAIAAIYIGTKWKGVDPSGNNAVVAFNEDSNENPSKVNPNNQHKFRVSQPKSYEEYQDNPPYQEYQRNPQVNYQMPVSEPNRNTNSQTQNTPQVSTQAVAPGDAPRQPRVIRPKRNPNAHVNLPSAQEVRYKTHIIVSGDTIYRIALRNNVKQQEILDLNNIADARKIRLGMVIKIPVK